LKRRLPAGSSGDLDRVPHWQSQIAFVVDPAGDDANAPLRRDFSQKNHAAPLDFFVVADDVKPQVHFGERLVKRNANPEQPRSFEHETDDSQIRLAMPEVEF
jgi:hypothetical protein